MGIKLRTTDTEWLAVFMQRMAELAPLKDFELATVTLAELYEKNLKSFILTKEFTLGLKQSDAMALKEMLLETGTSEAYSLFMINKLVAKIETLQQTKTGKYAHTHAQQNSSGTGLLQQYENGRFL